MIEKIRTFWLSRSDESRNLGTNLGWSIVGSLTSRILLFLAWIIIARLLGKDQYGEYGIIRNTVMMFVTIATSGMGQAVTKFVAEYVHQEKEKAQRIAGLITRLTLITGILIFLFAFLFAPYIANRTMDAPWLVTDFRIASFILLFSTFNIVQIGILEGLALFKKVAFINTMNGIISLPLFVIGTYYGGLHGSIIAYLLSCLLICILSHWQLYRLKKNEIFYCNYKEAWKERKLIKSFLFPALMSGIMVIPIKWISDVMLINGSGFGELGIFTAALTVNIILNSIAGMLNSPFLNIISRYKEKGIESIEKLNILVPWLIGLIAVLPLISFPELGEFLFGKDYAGEQFRITFIVVLLFSLLIMYKQGLARIMVVRNLQWFSLMSNILWGLSLILSFLYLRDLKSIGLAISYLIAYFVTTIMIYPIYIKRNYISKKMVYSWPVLAIWSVVMVVTLFSLLDITIYLRGVVLICATVCIFMLFKLIVTDQKMNVR